MLDNLKLIIPYSFGTSIVILAIVVYHEFQPPMSAGCAELFDRLEAQEALSDADKQWFADCKHLQQRYGQQRWHPNRPRINSI